MSPLALAASWPGGIRTQILTSARALAVSIVSNVSRGRFRRTLQEGRTFPRSLIRASESRLPMAQTAIEKELRLIRQRLESIEEALAEEMTEDDKRALREALQEHRAGRTVSFRAHRP